MNKTILVSFVFALLSFNLTGCTYQGCVEGLTEFCVDGGTNVCIDTPLGQDQNCS